MQNNLGSFIDLSQNSPFIMEGPYGIWDGRENKIESILEKPHIQKKIAIDHKFKFPYLTFTNSFQKFI